MAETLKPKRLQPGDRVAIVSPSWGGPSVHPEVYECGLRNLESLFGLEVVEFPTARMSQPELYQNPKVRAEDINNAFADPSIRGIIASIGGSESVRILPFLEVSKIIANPKILMGFSDTATMTTTLNQHDLVTFNGPSAMAGFAQMRHLPEAYAKHVRAILMEPTETHEYTPYEQWSDHYQRWETPGHSGEVAELQPNQGWRWLQGSGKVQGKLFGGCVEVFEFLKATPWWPMPEFWDGKILFLETSEEAPPVRQVEYWLRNYGSSGVLERINGIVYGRARSYTPEEKEKLYTMITRIVGFEFGRPNLPILANADFGHTEPQWVMPLGIKAEIDCDAERFRLLEPAVL